MAFGTFEESAVVRDAGGLVHLAGGLEGGAGAGDGEDAVLDAVDGAEAAGGGQACQVAHVTQAQHAGDVVAGAVLDQADAFLIAGEGGRGQGLRDAGVHRTGVESRGAAAGIAGDDDVLPVHGKILEGPVDQAHDVPDAVADRGAADQGVPQHQVAAGAGGVGGEVLFIAGLAEAAGRGGDGDEAMLGGLDGDIAFPFLALRALMLAMVDAGVGFGVLAVPVGGDHQRDLPFQAGRAHHDEGQEHVGLGTYLPAFAGAPAQVFAVQLPGRGLEAPAVALDDVETEGLSELGAELFLPFLPLGGLVLFEGIASLGFRIHRTQMGDIVEGGGIEGFRRTGGGLLGDGRLRIGTSVCDRVTRAAGRAGGED